jgi:hypothetical protein
MLTMIIQIAVAFVATVSFARYRRNSMSIRESVELPVGGATFWLWQITLPQQFPLLPQL